jgi:hypothetical protein
MKSFPLHGEQHEARLCPSNGRPSRVASWVMDVLFSISMTSDGACERGGVQRAPQEIEVGSPGGLALRGAAFFVFCPCPWFPCCGSKKKPPVPPKPGRCPNNTQGAWGLLAAPRFPPRLPHQRRDFSASGSCRNRTCVCIGLGTAS